MNKHEGSSMNHTEPVKELIGETLTHIDADESGDTIRMETASGKVITLYHFQDCCESVRIEDTQGNWHDLIGKVIVGAEKRDGQFGEPYEADSWTRTEFTFKVDDATVISRWIGESNGYYSESVDIKVATKRVRK